MAVQTAIARPIGTLHVGLLGIVLVAGASFGAGIGLGASDWLALGSRTDALTEAAPAFDAPAFRIDERLPLTEAAPAFDAPAFRIDERLPLTEAAPAFDAPAFRIDERLPLTEAAPAFDAPAFRLQEKVR